MIACTGTHSIVIDPNGQVWASEDADSKAPTFLSLTEIPPAVQIELSFSGKYSIVDFEVFSIAMIACAGHSAIALDNTGSLWGIGSNRYCELGVSGKMKQFTKLDTVNVGNIIKVRCGYRFSIILNQSGELWGTGFNPHGEYGAEVHSSQYFRKIRLNLEDEVEDFCCGMKHTLLIDKRGGAWITGHNYQGQLGLGDCFIRKRFTKIKSVSQIVNVICGDRYSMVIDVHGNLYATGLNCYGQLGLGHNNNVFEFQLVPNLPRITQGSLTECHSTIVDEDGGVWTCGKSLHPSELQPSDLFMKREGFPSVNCGSLNRFRGTKRAKHEM